MSEHIYLTRRNAEIRRLRFEEHRKLEVIVVIINRLFPDQTVDAARVSRILKVSQPTKKQF